MAFIGTLANGRPQILKREAFVEIRGGQIPTRHERFTQILQDLDDAIRAVEPNVSTGALSNSHGDWYEWMLAIASWNVSAKYPALNVAIPLPNKTTLQLSSLYVQSLSDKIDDLRRKVEQSSTVQLISSNPDFILIRRELADRLFGPITPYTKIDVDDLDKLNGLWSALVGNCVFEDIVGYLSVKSSLRPDRRLQISHEGSLMKALYVHLQTREWIINPPGLRYYAMATRVGASDRESLKTVATHSITTVASIPEPAVDEVYEVDMLKTAKKAFKEILA
ncbi:Cfr10I/Bse634I family restriction endonuclease [Pseudophaeobacter sp.]|uniref:Cfr10I/Bse634I family restriction endonuclease n=1 Tax=Pseudophaeobacter sp. TaxID=1971739 RepID=UPI0032D8BE21